MRNKRMEKQEDFFLKISMIHICVREIIIYQTRFSKTEEVEKEKKKKENAGGR